MEKFHITCQGTQFQQSKNSRVIQALLSALDFCISCFFSLKQPCFFCSFVTQLCLSINLFKHLNTQSKITPIFLFHQLLKFSSWLLAPPGVLIMFHCPSSTIAFKFHLIGALCLVQCCGLGREIELVMCYLFK